MYAFFSNWTTSTGAFGESLFWTVTRPQTVEAVTALLAAEPVTACRPRDLGWEDDLVFIEQRGDAVMLVSPSDAGVGEEALRPVARTSTGRPRWPPWSR